MLYNIAEPMIGYRAVLTIWICMAFAICGTEIATIKTDFCYGKD